MDENELLLMHAERWASDRKRAWDRDLVEQAISLRATHDGLAANRWPAGSVRHLMLTRWPAHGPLGVPDVAGLVDSLDTFWRFIRSTGRMSGGSAEPAVLLKEAKASAKKMPAACEDPALHGASKSMLAFGQEIGISLDDLPDMETANERLGQIMDAWNSLPIEERRRRSPGPSSMGSRVGDAMGAAANSVLATGHVPPGWSMPAPPRLDGLDEEEDVVRPNDPSVSAPHFRGSPFARKMRELLDWASAGRQVTDRGVLRVAEGRDAYESLGLWEWDRAWQNARSASPGQASDEVDAERRRSALTSWRSAMDCLPLARLWNATVEANLIDVGATKARPVPDALPDSDMEWMLLAARVLVSLGFIAQGTGCFDPLLGLLLETSDEYGGRRTVQQLKDWWWNSPANELAGVLRDSAYGREFSDQDVDRCLLMFGDIGLWKRRGDTVLGTPFGWDASLVLIRALEAGLFDEEE